MKRFFLPFLAMLLCGVSFAQNTATDGFRYWTNADGTKSSVKLKLIQSDGRQIKLAREGSDKTITYSIDKDKNSTKAYSTKQRTFDNFVIDAAGNIKATIPGTLKDRATVDELFKELKAIEKQ